MVLPLLVAALATVPAPSAGETERTGAQELAPGVRIERPPPDPALEARREQLRAWHRIYTESLAPLRRAVLELFEGLESSSLSSLKARCLAIRDRVAGLDREVLFPSSDVALDRVLYGALERFRAAANECLAGRNLGGYRLLLEARAGVEWVDRRLEIELAPRVRLPGLVDRDPPDRKR